jgi:hypothetical protein
MKNSTDNAEYEGSHQRRNPSAPLAAALIEDTVSPQEPGGAVRPNLEVAEPPPSVASEENCGADISHFSTVKTEPTAEPLEATEFEPEANRKSAQHEEMLSRIAVLERLMAELREPYSGARNQRSPEPGEDLSQGFLFGAEEVRDTEKAIAILKAQPVVPEGTEEAGGAASTLKDIGERIEMYLDYFLREAANSTESDFEKWLVRLPFILWALKDALIALANSVTNWVR